MATSARPSGVSKDMVNASYVTVMFEKLTEGHRTSDFACKLIVLVPCWAVVSANGNRGHDKCVPAQILYLEHFVGFLHRLAQDQSMLQLILPLRARLRRFSVENIRPSRASVVVQSEREN
jgi:hypothetical protein